MPMRSEQGSSASSGQFRSIPLSSWVLQIRPWMISLNIPSPPTHTTLQGGATLNDVTWSGWPGLWYQLGRAAHPSNVFSSASVFRWSLAWLAYSVTMATTTLLSKLQAYRKKKINKKKRGSDSGRTNRWRACGCQPVQTVVRPLAHRCACPFSSRRRGWCRPAGVWVCCLRANKQRSVTLQQPPTCWVHVRAGF